MWPAGPPGTAGVDESMVDRAADQVPPTLVVLGGTGLVTVGTMSIILSVRILVCDVLCSRPRSSILGHEEIRNPRRYCDGETDTRDDSTLSLKD